jgi:gamma-glutamylcyclotransferase (GGCT)/AIG2-like uncharacterized protein YtfP
MNNKKKFNWYFAYGSNMKQERLESRIKRSNLICRKGVLYDYTLCFNKAADDGSGYANIKISEGNHVWGVLYKLSDKELKRLDIHEGVSDHYLRNKSTQQWIKINNSQVLAEVYVANPDNINDSLKPHKYYLGLLIDGASAKNHDLPEEYIIFLKSFKTID